MTTQPNMMIPAKYLAKLGEHSINVDGVPVTVHVLDDPDLITYHIRKFEESVLAADIQVVGVDYKMVPPESGKLILYTAGGGGGNIKGNYCLIIHSPLKIKIMMDDKQQYESSNLLTELVSFLYNDNICFVKNSNVIDIGIEVGDLAARVLKNPALAQLRLAEIAREVGVPYVGPAKGDGMTIELDMRNPVVMSEEQVRVAVSDAFAHYRIGFELLSSVSNTPPASSKEGLTKKSFFCCF